jgi:intracellular septation protein A
VLSGARIARHAGRNLVEATIVPLVLFYAALWLVGVWGALWVALAWTWGAIAVRSARGRRVPGILLLGAIGLTVRTGLAMASGSVFIYFLQPTLTAFAIGIAFCGSVVIGRPLVARLAGDFCPLPAEARTRPAVRQLFNQLCWLWGCLNFLNALGALWLLTHQSLDTFLWAKTVMSVGMTSVGALVSIVAAVRVGRAEGILPDRPFIRIPTPEPAMALAV